MTRFHKNKVQIQPGAKQSKYCANKATARRKKGGKSRRDGRTECNGGLESPDVAKRNRRAPPGLSAPLTGGGRSRRLRLRSFFLLSNEQKKGGKSRRTESAKGRNVNGADGVPLPLQRGLGGCMKVRRLRLRSGDSSFFHIILRSKMAASAAAMEGRSVTEDWSRRPE